MLFRKWQVTGEIIQQLIAEAAPPENLYLIPSTHMAAYNYHL